MINACFVLIFLIMNLALLIATAVLILSRKLKTWKLRREGVGSATARRPTIIIDLIVPQKEINLAFFAMILSACMFLFVFYVYLMFNQNHWSATGRLDFFEAFSRIVLHLSIDVME